MTDWSAALANVDYVIHAAARVHVLRDSTASDRQYFETNAHGTRQLATQAAQAGVRRLIYLSSVKVNGEETAERSYSAADEPRPQDAYGNSKWCAERHLHEVAASSALECAIVRPPLVYGPGVRANFLRLMRWVDRELPLPLAAIHNKRSLVSVWNLCDLLRYLLTHPAAPGRTWMVCDDEDLSTPALIRRIGRAMDRRVRLLALPPSLLHLAGGIIGKRAEIARLCGSLAVDMTATRHELGWSPPMTVDESLAHTVGWYLREGRRNGA